MDLPRRFNALGNTAAGLARTLEKVPLMDTRKMEPAPLDPPPRAVVPYKYPSRSRTSLDAGAIPSPFVTGEAWQNPGPLKE
jgi:hypothetical protein